MKVGVEEEELFINKIISLGIYREWQWSNCEMIDSNGIISDLSERKPFKSDSYYYYWKIRELLLLRG